MRKTHLVTRGGTGAVTGILAVACIIALAACGGGSSDSSTAAASAAAASTTSEPPRPTGVPDAEWTDLINQSGLMDLDAMRADAQAKSPAELAAACQKPWPTDAEITAQSEQLVTTFPDSTVEEWVAFFKWGLARSQGVMTEVCAGVSDVPADGSADVTSQGAAGGSVDMAAAGTLADADAAAAAAAIVCDGSSTPCEIGNTGPGGGLVFYVDPAGFPCGDGAVCTALEGAPAGWSETGEEPSAIWCPDDQVGFNSMATDNGTFDPSSTVIGTGFMNTLSIVERCGEATAAGVASAYTGGGLNDWYLPSTAEFMLLARPMYDTGTTQVWNGLNNGWVYWTSSQSDPDVIGPNAADTVGVPTMEGNGAVGTVKKEVAAVHPIRAF